MCGKGLVVNRVLLSVFLLILKVQNDPSGLENGLISDIIINITNWFEGVFSLDT